MLTILLAAGVAAIAIAFSLPAHAANEIRPGLWEDTETAEINGKAEPPKVSTDCVKPEDAQDPVKMMQEAMKEQANQCSKFDVKQNGNVVTFAMICGDANQGIDMSVVYTIHSKERTSAVAKSTMSMAGQKMTSDMKTESKWIGECKDKK